MQIKLTEDREQFVRSLIRDGRYASEAEVIDEALRLLEQRDRGAGSERGRIESMLLDGLDSGPATPMTTGDWDDIAREGRRIIAERRARGGR